MRLSLRVEFVEFDMTRQYVKIWKNYEVLQYSESSNRII